MTEQTSLYRLFDTAGSLLYVGITKNLEGRLWRHSRNKAWWDTVSDIQVTEYSSRDQAAAAEFRAIRRESPRHNVVHNLRSASEAQEDSSPLNNVNLQMRVYVCPGRTQPNFCRWCGESKDCAEMMEGTSPCTGFHSKTLCDRCYHIRVPHDSEPEPNCSYDSSLDPGTDHTTIFNCTERTANKRLKEFLKAFTQTKEMEAAA